MSKYRPSVWELIKSYWFSKESWKGWIILIVQVTLMFTGVYFAVWLNQINGQIVDALVAREWSALKAVFITFLGVGLIASIVALLSTYILSEGLKYQWRSWMTKHYVKKWTDHAAFYGIEREASVDNADQRISQDIDRFIELTQSLTISPLRVIATIISFTIVLWNLSGTLKFSLGGYDFSITGYMVYIVYIYCIGDLLITHYTGKHLIHLFNFRQTAEANFRYSGMQLRENAEQIALYHGDLQEQKRLLSYFDDVRRNWRQIIGTTCKMMFARDLYALPGPILATLAALPRYLAGAITLGDLTRVSGAFDAVKSALSFFSQAYVSFAEWRAVSTRLQDLDEAINISNAQTHTTENILYEKSQQGKICSENIRLFRPNGELILEVPEIFIQSGERWLIRGPSGVGKSTLLRAVAGIWPYGTGKITVPENHKIMFVPQKSYIPTGTLKSALSYPSDQKYFETELYVNVLNATRLNHLIEHLEKEDRWQQKLSGGEQQRLAFARILLQRPDFLFLDESSSAMDPLTEDILYNVLMKERPDITLISVAHREALQKYHDHFLDLSISKS